MATPTNPPTARKPRTADRMSTVVPDAVKEIAALAAGGLSIRGIVAAMNDAGIPSATGKKWHIRTVQLALQQSKEP
jgi:hypothetical protein